MKILSLIIILAETNVKMYVEVIKYLLQCELGKIASCHQLVKQSLNYSQETLRIVRHSDDQLPELVTNNHKIYKMYYTHIF